MPPDLPSEPATILGTILAKICPPCARARRGADVPRITPGELCAHLRGGHDIALFDVRHPLDLLGDPRVLPRALRVRPQDFADGKLPLPRSASIVIYCAIPGEAGSEYAARNLRRRGYRNVRVLAGGFPAWRDAGLPLVAYDLRKERQLAAEASLCR